MARLGPLARTFDFVANAAPGVKEILTVGKFLWEVRERTTTWSWSTPSPPGTSRPARGAAGDPGAGAGRLVATRPGWMIDILGDPAQTGVVIVAAPEEMPVNETLELVDRLATETDVDLAAVVVNRVLPELFGRGEEEVFDRLRRARQRGRCSARRWARRCGRSSTAPSWR